MKICIISEGCYPYVVGGVSSWIHSLIKKFPNVEFILYNVVSSRDISGKFKYQFHENVSEVYECYLVDEDYTGKLRSKLSHRKFRFKPEEREAIKSLIFGVKTDWGGVFDALQNKEYSINDILMGPDFFEIVTDFYNATYPAVVFTDFLWTLRSIYLPLFHALHRPIPKADVYHCICTGYPGVLGAMGKHLYGSKLLISEHGIYPREREEELIKAKWVTGIYKNIWIDQFKKMSLCAYNYADNVTCLFEKARQLQFELGCPKEKSIVTPNGVDIEFFKDAPRKDIDDKYINVGALIRLAPIKDVKTLISAFNIAKKRDSRLKLWVMGPDNEDIEYANSCRELVDFYKCEDICFTGRIATHDYLAKMDMTVLTSISEGQPLSILEGFSCYVPAIATNVGNCEGLIYGERDDFGKAGIVVPIMDAGAIASAILELANNPDLRKTMGMIGYARCEKFYNYKYSLEPYRKTYMKYADMLSINWPEKPFVSK